MHIYPRTELVWNVWSETSELETQNPKPKTRNAKPGTHTYTTLYCMDDVTPSPKP